MSKVINQAHPATTATSLMVAICTALLASPSMADDDLLLEIKRCSVIENDGARLSCFDGLLEDAPERQADLQKEESVLKIWNLKI